MSEFKHVEVSDTDGIVIAALRQPDLLHGEGRDLSNDLVDLIERHRPQKLLIDCSGLKMMHSQAIGAVMRAYKRIAATSGEVRFSGMSPQTLEVFEMMQLHKILNISERPAEEIIAEWK